MATHYDTIFCIDTEAGVMDDCKAVFHIDTDYGTAELVEFRIGKWVGGRKAAVAMTGEDHVALQERLAADNWNDEQSGLYHDDDGDFSYEMWRDAQMEARQ